MILDNDKAFAKAFDVDERVIKIVKKTEDKARPIFEKVDKIAEMNQYKVLAAMQEHRLADRHFAWNTGYGYDDDGRDITERIFASALGAQDAVVRTQIVNGTHAIALALMGVLRPGDELIYCSGDPYDTLHEVIGTRGEGMGSLIEYGVKYKSVGLTEDGSIDKEAIKQAIGPDTKMVCIQRSKGYDWRKSITMPEIADWVDFIKSIDNKIICMVDNCYGEFLDLKEPTEVGVDIMAGSLIKNPGGGLALSGGYVAGRQDLIDMVRYRLTCPGIGGECGLTFGQTRTILQGLFFAPTVVAAASKGAILCSLVYQDLGFDVSPRFDEVRSDIIQGVKLGSAERLIAFCKGIQEASPVDSAVTPEPWPMPGYEDDVVMAAGAFVQGSSIELSADGPIREPYAVYFQGGLTYPASKIGVIKSLDAMLKKGLIDIEI